VDYHTHKDIRYRGDDGRKIRIHSFLTGREAGGIKPVFGLTSFVSSSVLLAISFSDLSCTPLIAGFSSM
jgi:hypothetical protein